MRKLALVMLSFGIWFWPTTIAQQSYTPPEVTSAGDAYTSYNVVFDGLFVLDVGLSDDGGIRRIEALRDPGSMSGAAKTLCIPGNFSQRPRAPSRELLA